jgi:anti-sigma regulatory factor (Ser/Thr protein kinase)
MEYNAISYSMEGEKICGDSYLVEDSGDDVLIVVVDGLGHGEEAAKAAEIARRCFEENHYFDLRTLISTCHERLRKTRGVTVGVVRIDRRRMKLQYSGIGNIGVKILSDLPIHPLNKPGILGANKINPLILEYDYKPPIGVILFSDGVSEKMEVKKLDFWTDPGKIAKELMTKYGRHTDDATIVVALERDGQTASRDPTSINKERGTDECTLKITNNFDVRKATKYAYDLSKRLGFSEVESTNIAIATSELARNIVVHADGRGEISIAEASEGAREGVEIIASDQGKGFTPAKAVGTGGPFSHGLGKGLASVRRLMDSCEIKENNPNGTIVRAVKWRTKEKVKRDDEERHR